MDTSLSDCGLHALPLLKGPLNVCVRVRYGFLGWHVVHSPHPVYSQSIEHVDISTSVFGIIVEPLLIGGTVI